jgi:hypothetical protein
VYVSYVTISPSLEYDPITLMIRQDGKERPAGFAGICFASLYEVQKQLQDSNAASATTAANQTAATDPTPWCPAPGAKDPRDAVPAGGGQVTQSGAPEVKTNPTPVSNQYNYTGPAALNPYFTTPSNPLREGYVEGFDKWFEEIHVANANEPSGGYTMNRMMCATQEGAQEALRLVRTLEPGAKLGDYRFGRGGGPYSADKSNYEIVLPNGGRLNAGHLLQVYYWGGWGASVASDMRLSSALDTAKGEAARQA